MAYRRGFKAEARNLALDLRAELGVCALDRLDPRVLAAHLDIPIWDVSDFVAEHPLVKALVTTEASAFSAVTVFAGTRRMIVHNDGHAEGRQNNNLAHELSHGLLHHPPTPALDDTGCRNWNQDVEDEATWLAGELLVTPDAAMVVARQQWTVVEAAMRLAVSQELIRYRVNVTGARTIVARSAASRRRATRRA